MTKPMPHNSSSPKVSSLTILIVVALAILALVIALLARSSSTQNDAGVVVSVPTHDVAGLQAASATTFVPSPDVAIIELWTNTPTYIAPTEVPTEVPSTDYGEAFYATAVAIAQ